MMLHNLITYNSLKINIHSWFLPGYGIYNMLTLIIYNQNSAWMSVRDVIGKGE